MQHPDLLLQYPIYFCNINIKHLQHTFDTPETLETYVCNMLFQRKHLLTCNIPLKTLETHICNMLFGANISLLLRQTEAHQRVEITGVLVGNAEVADNAKLGSVAQRAGWGRHGQRWRRGQGARHRGLESRWSVQRMLGYQCFSYSLAKDFFCELETNCCDNDTKYIMDVMFF